MNYETKNILVIGDTHTTNFKHLIKNSKDFILIHVGDAGLGFPSSKSAEKKNLKDLDNFCKENNGRVLFIRGNHDNPIYFKGAKFYDLDKIEFLQDYETRIINNKKFLFVGGAHSIDRKARKQMVDWWEDEKFKLKEELIQECDFLITHSSGENEFPLDKNNIKSWLDSDETLEEDLNRERMEIQKLVDISKPKYHFYGHFHSFCTDDKDGYLAICLGINDVVDITKFVFSS